MPRHLKMMDLSAPQETIWTPSGPWPGRNLGAMMMRRRIYQNMNIIKLLVMIKMKMMMVIWQLWSSGGTD